MTGKTILLAFTARGELIDYLRGIVQDISSAPTLVDIHFNGVENEQSNGWYCINEYLSPDWIVDPIHYNPLGMLIKLHDASQYSNVGDERYYYHVFRCEICKMYTKYLPSHQLKKHNYQDERYEMTSPRRRQEMRPRNLLNEY